MEQRIEKLEEFAADAKERLVRIGVRLDVMDGRFESIDRRFDDIDRRFDGIDKRLDGMDRRFDGIDKRLDDMQSRMATKADLAVLDATTKASIAALETTLIKWFVATAITLTSLVFVVVRFVK